jgi:hypothetical protein
MKRFALSLVRAPSSESGRERERADEREVEQRKRRQLTIRAAAAISISAFLIGRSISATSRDMASLHLPPLQRRPPSDVPPLRHRRCCLCHSLHPLLHHLATPASLVDMPRGNTYARTSSVHFAESFKCVT